MAAAVAILKQFPVFRSDESTSASRRRRRRLRECLWIIRFGIKFMICTHIIRHGARCGVSIKIKCLSLKCMEFVHVDALMKKYFNIIGTFIRSIVWGKSSLEPHYFVDDSEFIDRVTIMEWNEKFSDLSLMLNQVVQLSFFYEFQKWREIIFFPFQSSIFYSNVFF